MINADGTGTQWTDITVAQTPPGKNSRNREGAATDFPLVANVPANQQCTGTVAGQDNVCLVRCQNAARAGPFGGVVPVQMANTTTPAQARRNFARSLVNAQKAYAKMARRQTEEEEEEEDEE